MAQQYGFLSYIGMAHEAAWGTPNTTMTDWLRVRSSGIKNLTPFIPREGLGYMSYYDNMLGATHAGGPIVFDALYEGCEAIYAKHFGAPAVADNTDWYTWTFDTELRPNTGKGLTIQQNYAATGVSGFGYQAAGCKVNTLTFAQEKDQPLQCTAEVTGCAMAKVASPVAATFPWDATLEHDRPALEHELSVEIDDTPLTTSSSNRPTAFTFTSNNNFRTDNVFLGDGRTGEQFRNDRYMVSGTFTCDYDAETYYDYFVAARASAYFKLEFIYNTSYYITGANPYAYRFIFPRCFVTGDLPPEVSGPGIITATIPFAAVYDDTATYAFQMEIDNGSSALSAEG